MPFVDRDDMGAVRAVYSPQQRVGQEYLPENDPAVQAFRAKAARTATSALDDRLAKLEAWAQSMGMK